MAGAGAIYDNPGTIRQRQETQPIYAATQGHQGSLAKKVRENIYISTCAMCEQAVQCGGGAAQLIRPRPSSLSVEKRQFLRSVSQDTGRPASSLSMSTFSSCQASQPSTQLSPSCHTSCHSTPATAASPGKRSRSLQRGRGGGRHSRSVSSEGRGITRHAQLSHSTPQVRPL